MKAEEIKGQLEIRSGKDRERREINKKDSNMRNRGREEKRNIRLSSQKKIENQ